VGDQSRCDFSDGDRAVFFWKSRHRLLLADVLIFIGTVTHVRNCILGEGNKVTRVEIIAFSLIRAKLRQKVFSRGLSTLERCLPRDFPKTLQCPA
jgi:hypothetical protein